MQVSQLRGVEYRYTNGTWSIPGDPRWCAWRVESGVSWTWETVIFVAINICRWDCAADTTTAVSSWCTSWRRGWCRRRRSRQSSQSRHQLHVQTQHASIFLTGIWFLPCLIQPRIYSVSFTCSLCRCWSRLSVQSLVIGLTEHRMLINTCLMRQRSYCHSWPNATLLSFRCECYLTSLLMYEIPKIKLQYLLTVDDKKQCSLKSSPKSSLYSLYFLYVDSRASAAQRINKTMSEPWSWFTRTFISRIFFVHQWGKWRFALLAIRADLWWVRRRRRTAPRPNCDWARIPAVASVAVACDLTWHDLS